MTKQQSSIKWALLLAPALVLLIEQWGTATNFDLNEGLGVGTIAAFMAGVERGADRLMRIEAVRDWVIDWALGYREKYGEKPE